MPTKTLYSNTSDHPVIWTIKRRDFDAGNDHWPEVGAVAFSAEAATEMLCQLAGTTIADAFNDYQIHIDPNDPMEVAKDLSRVVPDTDFEVDVFPVVSMTDHDRNQVHDRLSWSLFDISYRASLGI